MENASKETKALVSAPMTKDLLMKYTLVALIIIAATSIAAFGMDALVMIVISVAVAVVLDYSAFALSRKKNPLNLYSTIVAAMIVALSFSSGIPYSTAAYNVVMDPKYQYIAIAIISAITLVIFKKIQGLLGRKYVNPAAAAKLIVLAPILNVSFIPLDHTINNIATFAGLKAAIDMSYTAHPPLAGTTFASIFSDPILNLTLFKNHGWLGGASSIAVIAVGIGFMLISKGYVKWKIPLAYLATVAIISGSYGLINGENIILRMAFHLFIGSSIFLAFFMATDPATTPLSGLGQIIFAIGVGVLSFVFQISLMFLGGSILALVIMNLTTPLLNRIGLPKPIEKREHRKLPKAKKFENPTLTNCMGCGRCLQVCCRYLSPILIKEAADHGNWDRVRVLRADYCEGCGHCTYVCPVRIDLKAAVLNAKAKIQTNQ